MNGDCGGRAARTRTSGLVARRSMVTLIAGVSMGMAIAARAPSASAHPDRASVGARPAAARAGRAVVAGPPDFSTTGSISGTVRGADGLPITGRDICVTATPFYGTGGVQTTTDAAGAYTITGLSPGTYAVRFADCSFSARNDVSQYYGGAPDVFDSKPVALFFGGQRVTGVDAALAVGTSITGHAYAGPGPTRPVAGMCVTADAARPTESYYFFSYRYTGQTAGSGAYTLGHVAAVPGGYTVEFTDCNRPVTYVNQFYGGDYRPSSAVVITPTVASPAAGIDAHLQVGGSITGSVSDPSGTPISSGVCVTATLLDRTDSGSSTPSGGGGAFAIVGLPAGAYTVTVADCTDARNDVSQTLAGPVMVTAGAATTGVNAILRPGTSISGHVYGGPGTRTPLGSRCVYALAVTAGPLPRYILAATATTGPFGGYQLLHLDPSSRYIVSFNVCDQSDFGAQYYDGVADPSQAAVLAPTVAQPVTGIDAHLSTGPPVTTITGGPADGATTAQSDARFSFTTDQLLALSRCSVDGAPLTPCVSPYDAGTLPAGRHTFTVASSNGGLSETRPPTVTWTVAPASPASTYQGQVTPGGTFSSDPGGSTSSATPLIVAVTPPAASRLTVTTEPVTTPSPGGYVIFGRQAVIVATTAAGATVTGTVADPITVTFTVDPGQIPAGADRNVITVTRDGTPAPSCSAPDGTANPDPCVAGRTTEADGALQITVLTTRCSTWNLAAPVAQAGGGSTSTSSTPAPTPAAATPPAGTPRSPTSLPPVAVPSRAVLRRSLSTVLAPTGRAARIRRLLTAGGFRFAFVAPSAGTLRIRWYDVPRGAHLARARTPVLVARGTLTVSAAGRVRLRIVLTSAGRRLLRGARRLGLTSVVTFAPRGGTAIRVTRRFTLRR